MTKELIYQEDVAILNVYIQDSYKVHEAKTDRIEKRSSKSTIIVKRLQDPT